MIFQKLANRLGISCFSPNDVAQNIVNPSNVQDVLPHGELRGGQFSGLGWVAGWVVGSTHLNPFNPIQPI